jgi:hypothetical protein
MGNNTLADVSASVSLLSAAVSITAIQPYVSLLASLIGICSGSVALRYYYFKMLGIGRYIKKKILDKFSFVILGDYFLNHQILVY